MPFDFQRIAACPCIRSLEYRPQLESTPAAREAARLLLWNPPLPLVARPGYATLAAGAVALLPAWARRELGLPLTGPLAGGAHLLGGLGTRAVRWGMAGVRAAER